MDIQKIAHIGTESVLFIGMFVYFNNQIRKLKEENEELKNKMATLHENTNKQLNNIYMILDTFKNNMTPTPIHPKQVYRQPQKGMSLQQSGMKQRKIQFSEEDIVQPHQQKSKNRTHEQNHKIVTEDDLDAELGDELEELQEEDEEEEYQSKEINDSYNISAKKK